jgi:5-methylthioadenosine/S-adenosylhomocysteine deaminase
MMEIGEHGEHSEAEACDLLVRNAFVITIDEQRRVIPNGCVAVQRGLIVGVGPEREVTRRFVGRREIDAHGGVVHPGLIDSHLHVTCIAGQSGMSDTAAWRDVVAYWSAYWNTLDDEDEYLATLLACIHMVRCGTTCFMEAGTVLEPDAAAKAVEAVGMRAVLGDAFLWDIGGFSSDAPAVARAPANRKRALRLLGGQLKRNADPDALVRGHIALIGMGSASDELQMAAKVCADKHGVVVNQHQSYSAVDVDDDVRRLKCRPLLHYAELGVLGTNATLVHVNVLDEEETAALVASGSSIVWCLKASMFDGLGGTFYGPHLELIRAGANIALGTDSEYATDLGESATLAVLTAREKTREKAALSAEDAFEMMTVNGARAIGASDQLGSLEVGKRADIVIRDTAIPEALPRLNPILETLYTSRARSVGCVIVGGEVILENGRLVRLDIEPMLERIARSGREVQERMDWHTKRRWTYIA